VDLGSILDLLKVSTAFAVIGAVLLGMI